jgi:hypothetical protein
MMNSSLFYNNSPYTRYNTTNEIRIPLSNSLVISLRTTVNNDYSSTRFPSQDRQYQSVTDLLQDLFEVQFVDDTSELDRLFQTAMIEDDPNRRATNKNHLEQLPVYKHEESSSYQRQFCSNKECSVCICEFSENERLVPLPCSHIFHEDCIKPWLQSHNSCPVCRYELEMENETLDRERKTKMLREFGEYNVQLMQLTAQAHVLYGKYQRCKRADGERNGLRKLQSNCDTLLHKVSSVSIPRKHSDKSRLENQKLQLIERIQFIKKMIVQSCEEHQIPMNLVSPNQSSDESSLLAQVASKVWSWIKPFCFCS